LREEAVLITDINVVGFIKQHFIGGAQVTYEYQGITYEEYLSNEDYEILEEWTTE
jgi:hypothetical protein